MTKTVSIFNMRRISHQGEKSDVVASFNAHVGDFLISRAQVRRRHSDGGLFVATPGRGDDRAHISLTKFSPTMIALSDAALTMYAAFRAPVTFDDGSTFDDGTGLDQ
ncbi:hypothetical protein [Ensifer adhaerens]|uniref:hypothetical protein n=1 Tax=Ensifer adhaerens TaxID=106592 RepID=UPI00098EE427|nr:hypothetical protein [Ensifer adhaerens]